MTELTLSDCETAGGGMSVFTVYSILGFAGRVGAALYAGTNALGATLRNYYGDEATLESFRGGNLGA